MFAVDDDIESSTKFEALDELPGARRARAYEAWLRLGAACRKRGNGGLVTPALLAKVLHVWSASERAQAMADLAEARGGREHGLVHVDGATWRFHEWEAWQPTAAEASQQRQVRTAGAERTRRWRMKSASRDDADTPSPRDACDVTGDVDQTVTTPVTVTGGDVSRARDPVPSRPSPSQIDLDHARDLDQVAREDVDTPLRRLRIAFSKRWLAKRLPNGMGLGTAWTGFGRHSDLALQRANEFANDAPKLERSLDGFFATNDKFLIGARYPFKSWADNPERYQATRSEPTANAVAIMARVPRSMETP